MPWNGSSMIFFELGQLVTGCGKSVDHMMFSAPTTSRVRCSPSPSATKVRKTLRWK
jgi:hypothetical protein